MFNQKIFLQETLERNEFNFSDQQIDQFCHYLNLLKKWNRTYNLTAITDNKQMVLWHILDSLVVSPFLHGQRFLDVGTGAGLPGIPLSFAFPEKQFVLLDSNGKKTRFLSNVVRELQLKNVEVVQARVEAFQTEHCFDSILARAFSSLRVIIESTRHLLCKEGQILAMKGTYPEKEIRDIPEGFKLLTVHSLRIKGLNAERHLVCMGFE